MSVKSVLKKNFKIKNPIVSFKNKKQKNKNIILDSSLDTYNTFDPDRVNTTNESSISDGVQNKTTVIEKPIPKKNCHEVNSDNSVTIDSITSIKKKRKSINIDTNNEYESTKKKKVTFAADVKSENDQKCTAGNMKLLSLNKRKKLNYIKKLKAKKKKQKNANKCEENFSTKTPRQEKAIKYLMQWKNDRSNWKFKKIYQLWLIKNTYDPINVCTLHKYILKKYF